MWEGEGGGPPDAGEYWATFVSDRACSAPNIDFWLTRVEIDAFRVCVNIPPRVSHGEVLWQSRSSSISITY